MLRLNLRKGDSTWRFSDSPTWTDQDGAPLSEARVRAILGGARVCFLIHGYNVKKAADSYRALAWNLQGEGEHVYDVIVEVWWPGGEWVVAFPFAWGRATKAGRLLTAAINNILAEGPLPERIDVQAHSLGCRVALETDVWWNLMLLAAPAVDNEALDADGPYGVTQAEKIIVCFSNNDPVSKGYWLSRRDKMLGVSGPQHPGWVPHNAKFVDFTPLSDHSGYREDPRYFRLWRAAVETPVGAGRC